MQPARITTSRCLGRATRASTGRSIAHGVSSSASATTIRSGTWEWLKKTDAPLLIWGELDARSPLSVAHQFEEAIPDTKLVVIPRCGHVARGDPLSWTGLPKRGTPRRDRRWHRPVESGR